MPKRYRIAIIGAGASGLMVAERLSAYDALDISVFEQLPSVGRKMLMAGKTGLNLSNNRPLADFIAQYHPPNAILKKAIANFPPTAVAAWCEALGVATYIGSSGRLFPVCMKAAPLLRAWVAKLQANHVKIYCRQQCLALNDNQLTILDSVSGDCCDECFDVIILACGGNSYARLGATGAWTQWLDKHKLTPFFASNVGVLYAWSDYMADFFGQPIKGVKATAGEQSLMGDVMISHYGLEGGIIYALNHALRATQTLYLDLLPAISVSDLEAKLSRQRKQSLGNRLKKCGLDATKIALFFEYKARYPNSIDWRNDKQLSLIHI